MSRKGRKAATLIVRPISDLPDLANWEASYCLSPKSSPSMLEPLPLACSRRNSAGASEAMPLFKNAEYLIRANLQQLASNNRVRSVEIGRFTADQFEAINRQKEAQELPLLEDPGIVFIGSHAYRSRVIRDGSTIDDMVLQIEAALAATSIWKNATRMTALRSTIGRDDGYGNEVFDEAIFELTARKPKAELYSIIPKGDRNKPKK